MVSKLSASRSERSEIGRFVIRHDCTQQLQLLASYIDITIL